MANCSCRECRDSRARKETALKREIVNYFIKRIPRLNEWYLIVVFLDGNTRVYDKYLYAKETFVRMKGWTKDRANEFHTDGLYQKDQYERNLKHPEKHKYSHVPIEIVKLLGWVK